MMMIRYEDDDDEDYTTMNSNESILLHLLVPLPSSQKMENPFGHGFQQTAAMERYAARRRMTGDGPGYISDCVFSQSGPAFPLVPSSALTIGGLGLFF